MSDEGKLKVVITSRPAADTAYAPKSAPDVYKLDENGIVYVDDEIVPEGLEDAAKEGAEACPQSALKVVAA